MPLHRGSCKPRGAIVLGRRLKAIDKSQGAALRSTKAFKKYKGIGRVKHSSVSTLQPRRPLRIAIVYLGTRAG